MSHRSYENHGVPISQDHRRDDQTDSAEKPYTPDFEDFFVQQQKEVVIRPVWQPQAEDAPTQKVTSDGRSYQADSLAASHPIHNRVEKPGRRK